MNETEFRRLPGRIKKQEIALRKAVRVREAAELALAAETARVTLDAWANGYNGITAANAESRRELATLVAATHPALVPLRIAYADALDIERGVLAEVERLRALQVNLREVARFTTARISGGLA